MQREELIARYQNALQPQSKLSANRKKELQQKLEITWFISVRESAWCCKVLMYSHLT